MKILTRLAAVLAAASIAVPAFACGLMHEETSAQVQTPAPAVVQKAQPQHKAVASRKVQRQAKPQQQKVAQR